MTERADVAIVGGGVIGCALARELAARGRTAVVLERALPGEEASGAAAGLLSPQSDFRAPGALFDLAVESRRLYADWVRDVESESGTSVGYRRTGLLRCAATEEDLDGLSEYDWQKERGLALERWGFETVAARFAGRLAPEIEGGVFFPDEAVVDSRRLVRALWTAAERRGARIETRRPATGLWLDAGRCCGVETDRGRIAADAVVNAAGAWAGFERRLPAPVPVEPVRGQIVELETGAERLPTVLQSHAVYLVPREGGRIILGSTTELAGFEKEVTAGGLRLLISEAVALLPALSGSRFVAAWSGLRPGTPDGMPLLGGCDVPGLYFATGHYRYGILLAPVTALMLADLLTGATPALDPSPFSVGRFGGKRPPRKTTEENVFS